MKEEVRIIENEKVKLLRSPEYNYNFVKTDGYFERWGAKKEDDPLYSPVGPEIADIEISTVCNGLDNKPCKFCYKSNTGKGHNMTLETFKKVFHNLPRTLTQIAFGIGDIDANPDMWSIFDYCRTNDVIPNVTINGARLTPVILDRLANTCGAIAVSRYENTDYCYNAVKELTDRGMKQVNIHQLLAVETYDKCIQAIDDISNDSRLEKLNAIVFLALKPKGRGKTLTPFNDSKKYKELIEYAFGKGVNIGFDSCSAPMFLEAMKDSPDYEKYEMLAEPCESYLFSIYVNEKGTSFPCSFLEDESEGINLTQENLELEDYWFAESTNKWRKELLETAHKSDCLVKGCRQCPKYDIY